MGRLSSEPRERWLWILGTLAGLALSVVAVRALRQQHHQKLNHSATTGIADEGVATPLERPEIVSAPFHAKPARVEAPRVTSSSDAASPERNAMREQREEYEALLSASGAREEQWHHDAEKSLRAFERAVTEAGLSNVKLTEVGCFHDGCEAKIVAPDRASLQAADAAILNSEAFHQYPGAKHRTGLEDNPDKTIAAAWILFPPQVSSPFSGAAAPPRPGVMRAAE